MNKINLNQFFILISTKSTIQVTTYSTFCRPFLVKSTYFNKVDFKIEFFKNKVDDQH